MEKDGKDKLRPREIIGLLPIGISRAISWALGVLACTLYVIDLAVGGLLILAGLAISGQKPKINRDAIFRAIANVWKNFH